MQRSGELTRELREEAEEEDEASLEEDISREEALSTATEIDKVRRERGANRWTRRG